MRITGLDEVPNADDPFHVVADLATAREIAEKRKARRQEAVVAKPAPAARSKTLGTDGRGRRDTELKVILKADFRGSVEAIRKELEKLDPRGGAASASCTPASAASPRATCSWP